MAAQPYTKTQYENEFLVDEKITERALANALDIRSFEIGLYWTRAAYFWTFTGAALAGFLGIQVAVKDPTDSLVLLSTLGFVFSVGWVCVNKGSKYWQENWERHVDLLEDKLNGPLYKVVMQYEGPTGLRKQVVHWLTGPAPISVSRLNQVISVFVSIVWLVLLLHSLPPFDVNTSLDLYYTTLCTIAGITCVIFARLCRSEHAQKGVWATKRVPQ
jgi:hypothetical protein